MSALRNGWPFTVRVVRTVPALEKALT
jgi:hypothetical protein